MNAPKIPIQFVADITQLEPALTVFNKIGLLADDELATFKAANAEFAKRSAIIQQVQQPMDKLAKSAGDVGKNLIGGASNKVLEDLQKRVASLTAEVEKLRSKTKPAGADVENSLRGMTQRWKELVTASNAAFAAGDKALGKELRNQAGELKDSIGDIRAEINALASDTATLDGLLQAVTAVGAGFQSAQGLIALVDDENQDLQKTLVKLQAVMALVSGLQQIQNVLQKESALRVMLSNLQERIGLTQKTQMIVLKRAENVSDGTSEIMYRKIISHKIIDNALTSKSALARGAATAAQWLLNNAMYAFPVVAILAGLAALAAAYGDFRTGLEKAVDMQLLMNRVSNLQLDILDAMNERMRQRAKDSEATLSRELELLQAQGASQETIRAKELELAQLRANNAAQYAGANRQQIQDLESNSDALEKLRKEEAQLGLEMEKINKQQQQSNMFMKAGQDQANNLRKAQIESIQEVLKSNIELYERRVKLGEEARDSALDSETDLAAKQSEIQRDALAEQLRSELAFLQARLRIAREGSAEQASLQIAVRRKETEIDLLNTKLTAGERFKIETELQADIKDLNEQYQKKRLADELAGINAQLNAVRRGSQEEYDLKLKALEVQQRMELNNYKLTANQREEIVAKSQRAIDDLTADYLKKATDDQLNAERLGYEARLLLTREGTAERLKIERDMLAVQEQLELNAIDKLLVGTELGEAQRKAIIAKYQADRQAMERENVERILSINYEKQQMEADHLQRMADLESNSVGQKMARRFELELQGLNNRSALLEQQARDERVRFVAGVTTYEEYQRNLTSIQNAQEELRLEKSNAVARQEYETRVMYAEKTQEMVGQLSARISEIQGAYSEKQIQRYEQELAFYTDQKEKGYLTEEAYNNKKLQLEARIREQKVRDAKWQKALAVTQILIDTSVAVVKALPNLILAGIVGAFGAAAAIAAAARPIPQFYKGTKNAPSGWAWVGEKGPELIKMKGGEEVKTHEDSLAFASKALMDEVPTLSREAIDKSLVLTNDGVKFDVDKLADLVGEKVGEQLARMPLTQFTFDKNGFNVSLVEGRSKTNFITNYFQS